MLSKNSSFRLSYSFVGPACNRSKKVAKNWSPVEVINMFTWGDLNAAVPNSSLEPLVSSIPSSFLLSSKSVDPSSPLHRLASSSSSFLYERGISSFWLRCSLSPHFGVSMRTCPFGLLASCYERKACRSMLLALLLVVLEGSPSISRIGCCLHES